MSEQKPKVPTVSTEELLRQTRDVGYSYLTSQLGMNAIFAATAKPARPIVQVWDVPKPQPEPQPQLQSVPELQPQTAQPEPAPAAHSVAA